ncbi:protein UPSTREAM OF FLC-like [Forsythia ovata]|uniref:Protein UPSTREAM OF FLC-like n=1 Tax=Forsythia ovata TaxID=205694 RepID=A0ABD1T346_9LAMI
MIHPTNSNDYVLKGSKLLQRTTSPQSEALSSITVTTRRKKNQSWSSFENPNEKEKYNYRVIYKSESSRELGRKFDAATQTEETTGRRRRSTNMKQVVENKTAEMISSKGLEYENGNIKYQSAENGKMKASQVFRKLITCGSSVAVKEDLGPMKK